MNRAFADTYYYLALVNNRDAGHARAVAFSQGYSGTSVTTEWVLVEVADALSSSEQRPIFLALLEQLRNERGLSIAPASHEMFERGVELFARRPDKNWTLTDCISFVVMQDLGITEALTADHHFEQAGFNVLLK